eukprot:c25095_g1_i1 orf=313-2358(+)
MFSNLTLVSTGAANEKDYISGQDVTTPLHPLHPFYLNNNHEVSAALHATHKLYDVANPSQHRQGSHHFDQITNLALLHNELLQGSGACVDEQPAGSDLSSEVGLTAEGTRSRPSWSMKGPAQIHIGTTMDMENSKTIDLRHEGLVDVSESINIGDYVGLIYPERRIASFDNPKSDILLSLSENSNAHNLGEQKKVQRGYEQPYFLAGRNGGTVRTSPEYGFSAQYPRGNSRGEVQHMISINAGDNMMSQMLNEIEQEQQEAISTLIPRNISTVYSAATATNYDASYAAAASAILNDMDALELLHKSSLHDHSLLFVEPPDLHKVQSPGKHQFQIACTKASIPLARWDKHFKARAATLSSLQKQEKSARSRSTFLNNPGNVQHQETSSRDAAVSLYLQSRTHGQHHTYTQPSDLPSLDFTYLHTGSGGLLRSSQYLIAAQELFEELCSLKPHYTGAPHGTTCSQSLADRHVEAPPLPKQNLSVKERCQLQMRKARLVGMVEELDRRYQQYREQMQLLVTSYESATGMGAAAPYTALARKLISRQFKALRNTIAECITAACRSLGEDISSVAVLSKGETPRLRILEEHMRHYRALQQVWMLSQQHQVWRPQRGLPERSVAVLRAWLFENFLHPYPKDSEKLMLARLSGLTRNQVINWFINARVRLWKPMVEQMYAEERKEGEL